MDPNENHGNREDRQMKVAILFTIIIILLMLTIAFAESTDDNVMSEAEILRLKILTEIGLLYALAFTWILFGITRGQADEY